MDRQITTTSYEYDCVGKIIKQTVETNIYGPFDKQESCEGKGPCGLQGPCGLCGPEGTAGVIPTEVQTKVETKVQTEVDDVDDKYRNIGYNIRSICEDCDGKSVGTILGKIKAYIHILIKSGYISSGTVNYGIDSTIFPELIICVRVDNIEIITVI